MIAPLPEWTVMIYFAAPDGNLTVAAFNNLETINRVGSTDQVHILAQFDNSLTGTNRFVIPVGGGLGDPIPLDEPNTGSVTDFVDFIKWGINGGHRAKRYLIVLWGHGNGVEDFPGDESSSPSAIPVRLRANASRGFQKQPVAPVEVAVGSSADSVTGVAAKTKPANSMHSLLPDDSPRDALTSRELGEALAQATKELGVDKIHIVGMDACLMSMVEIARQIRDSAALMVASEQTIPDASWPYGNIIRKLNQNPTFEPTELAQLIVDEYIAFYQVPPTPEAPPAPEGSPVPETPSTPAVSMTPEQVALSVCDLGKAETLTEAIGQLVKVLRQCLATDGLRLAVVKARFSTLSFYISDFIDLYHFCIVLQDVLASDPFNTTCQANAALCGEVKTACKRVMEVIRPEAGSGFVIKSAISFPEKSAIMNANGVSIYFPLILPLYGELEFSKSTNWAEFLKDFIRTFFLQADVTGWATNHTSRSTPPIDGNGSNSKGGITTMAQTRTPCLVVPQGTTINDKAKGFVRKVTGLAFLDMTPNPRVHVPGGTQLDIPGEGVKASSGTEMKTTPAGTRLGTPVAPVVEMVVPACTLRETTTGTPKTELSAGTSIKTQGTSSPIIALAKITVAPPKPPQA